MLSRRFPPSAFYKRASQAIILVSSLGLATSAVSANGKDDPKNNERTAQQRPVARLIATSTQGVSPRERPRLVARVSSTSNYVSTNAASVAATGDERRAFELVNAERQRRGVRPLILDGELTRIARYHSETMARDGVLDHVDRDGLDLSGRAAAFGLHGWRALGENIAYNQGFDDPTAFAVERWMISVKHRENILNSQFTHAGIGIARAADGRIFFTQVFMER
ncbi:MAG TPA: CAP domain-containing protein [Pyrinomonadaceae bacterium]|jgi:uncharacterized protein YkwD|nr:CAP domain-containing protein [Pyrinomonadaceae bacterium]